MSEFADAIATLKAEGLLGRVTSVRVGDTEVEMLPSLPAQVASEKQQEMAAERDHNEIMFASA